MDFLRAAASVASAALSGAGSLPGLPGYTLGARDVEYDGLSIWTLYEGTKRDDQTSVSIFSFDVNAPGSFGNRRALLPLARNALRKLKTLRHPDVLKFLDGSETETSIWIVTEHIMPLTKRLGPEGQIRDGGTEEWKVWGLSRVTNALSFINSSGASTHGNLRLSSIFISPGGEWRVGGFEVLSALTDPTAVLYSQGSLLPNATRYMSPETRSSGYGVLNDLPCHALDAYQLSLLIYTLFNGPLPASFSTDPHPALPQTRASTPLSIFTASRRLATVNASGRMKIETFHEMGMAREASQPGAGFYSSNRLIKLAAGLENFALASEGERAALLRIVKDSNQALPPDFLSYKVLPALVKAYEFGPGGPQLLPLMLSLGASLPPADYTSHLLQPIVRTFASPDRAMRLALLDGLPSFCDKLDGKVVVEKVWPHLLTGFTDIVPVIREATVKSILVIAPKLTERILNNDLLRYLAKTQTDPEPGIRTNTCILLGRLSKHLTMQTNRKVLVPAFARSLRDNFVHARIAGLMALMATVECYEREDLAGKVIPSMAICLVDKEKTVRDQAFKAMDMFVKRVEAQVADMPATVLPPAAVALSNGDAAAPAPPGLATNAAGAAGVLAGWAFSSISKRLASGDLETPIERPSSAPPPVGDRLLPTVSESMRSPSSSRSTIDSFAALSVATADSRATSIDEGMDDWGGDLIDVNADADDWDAFESAPASDPLAARLSSTRKPASLQATVPQSRPAKMPPIKSSLSTPVGGTLRLGNQKATSTVQSSLAKQLEAEAAGGGDEANWDLDDGSADAWNTPANGTNGAATSDWGSFAADEPKKTVPRRGRTISGGRGSGAKRGLGPARKLGP